MWERRISSSGTDYGLALATDSKHNVFVGGWYGTGVTVGTEEWPTAENDCTIKRTNAFLLRLSP